MRFKAGAEASARRWRAFWRHDVADRPPMVVHYRDAEEGLQDPDITERVAYEAQLTPEYVLEGARLAEEAFERRAGFDDDTFPQVSAPSGLGVTGWILGSEVRLAAGIPWVDPVLDRVADWTTIDLDAARRRYERILAIDRALVAHSRGEYAVSAASLDGPADMAVRLLGEEKLALALYEEPDEVRRLFAALTALWRDLSQKKLAALPRFLGGTVTGWDYWVPGPGAALQEDFGQMVSPTHFRQMILAYDRQLLRQGDFVWFHVHSGGLHMAKEIAEAGVFAGIQICNDYPAGPPPEEMLLTLRFIQERSPLILRKFSLDQLERIVGHLSPKGLAIDIQCFDSAATDDIQTTIMSRAEAERVLQWANGWMSSAKGSASSPVTAGPIPS